MTKFSLNSVTKLKSELIKLTILLLPLILIFGITAVSGDCVTMPNGVRVCA